MSPGSKRQAILLMAHGSRDPEARKEYRRIHAAMQARLSPTPVLFAVNEFPGDDGLLSIEEGWRAALDMGAERVIALPFFLFPAGHVREDLPGELRAAHETIGGLDVDLLPPLGAADAVLDAVEDRARAIYGPNGDGETALILVGAGTSDPDANGDLCKATRLLWERVNGEFALVETAWVSLTRPSVGEAIDRCVKLGATRIALVPYFLNTGVLLKRIDDRLAEARLAHPSVPMVRGSHLGLHPRLLGLLEQRARAALDQPPGADPFAAVCGRPSCVSVARGRIELTRAATPAR